MKKALCRIFFLLLILNLYACNPAPIAPPKPQDLSHDRDLPLARAIEAGDFKTVTALLKQGVNPDQRERGSLTPLMQSLVLHGNTSTGTKICRELIRHGADVNLRSANYDTALIYAAIYGNKDVIRELLKKGADINAKNAQGVSPLHGAIINDRRTLMIFLMNEGGDVDAQDILGISPLMTAVSQDLHSISAHYYLAFYGKADLNLKDNNGNTATYYCKYPGYESDLRSMGAMGRSPNYSPEVIPPTLEEKLTPGAPLLQALVGSLGTSTSGGGLAVDPSALGSAIGNVIAEKTLEESPPEVMDVKAGLMVIAPRYQAWQVAVSTRGKPGPSVKALAGVITRAWTAVGEN